MDDDALFNTIDGFFSKMEYQTDKEHYQFNWDLAAEIDQDRITNSVWALSFVVTDLNSGTQTVLIDNLNIFEIGQDANEDGIIDDDSNCTGENDRDELPFANRFGGHLESLFIRYLSAKVFLHQFVVDADDGFDDGGLG